ncbi:hypothetical protein [Arthrobacter caoxuetaonis]|uniref:Lipoprotein n=1 Tax=Arthrobacter caoxuetaonis TaxID=2886935 RepID=A0A9X1MI97_9MICC|nr:hypothetical protein [Arthrobacter caoxuetaonis]MCC3299780.1 hypothetical protein [Arthrobacter caoxuetaonis]USQ59319.1 hypothetical protein NF551_17195 [Arthrobacter caoxuetaonis]
MKKWGMAAAVFAAGSLVLTGCGGSSADTTSGLAPEPSETAPPANGGTYATVVELKDAFVEAGGECPAFDQDNAVTLAAESADCSDSAVLSTFLSSSTIDQLIQDNKEVFADIDFEMNPWLVGENWVINAPGAAELREKLGGTVVSW